VTRGAEKRYRFGPAGASPALVSVTHDILGDPFWAVYRNGLRDAAERFGCDVRHLAPETFSPPGTARLLAEAVDTGPDGLLATIPDPAAVEPELRRAHELGIPVIAVNAADPRRDGERIPYLHYIGASDEAAGAEVARRQLRGEAPASAVCLDHYLHEHVCHHARASGYLQVMRDAGVEAERVRIHGDEPSRALDEVRSVVAAGAHPLAVCTLGPPGAAAVSAALEAERPPAPVRHASFDLAPEQLAAIAAGTLDFSVDSQQYLQGFLGVALLHLHVTAGFRLAGDVLTGPAFVDAGNREQVEQGVAHGLR
jgi:simple sugar transport system substrate-binding protein